jgi:hypothetical protein
MGEDRSSKFVEIAAVIHFPAFIFNALLQNCNRRLWVIILTTSKHIKISQTVANDYSYGRRAVL